jgi:ABC-2 type transport system ATP-binding protein
VLDGGAVVATGSADELKRRLGTEQVELLLDGPADPALVLLGDAVVRSEAGTVWVATDGSAAHLRHVLDTLAGGGVGVATATPRRPTLDDVFLTLTGSGRTRPDATRPDATRPNATRPDVTLEGASR